MLILLMGGVFWWVAGPEVAAAFCVGAFMEVLVQKLSEIEPPREVQQHCCCRKEYR